MFRPARPTSRWKPASGPPARRRSAGQPGQETVRLVPPRLEQPMDERRTAVQLAGQVEVEVDLTDHDAPVLITEAVRPLVHLADEVQLLLQRKIAGQFVTPVGDVAHTHR